MLYLSLKNLVKASARLICAFTRFIRSTSAPEQLEPVSENVYLVQNVAYTQPTYATLVPIQQIPPPSITQVEIHQTQPTLPPLSSQT